MATKVGKKDETTQILEEKSKSLEKISEIH